MEKKRKTEAVSEYVLKRIDNQNGIVGAVLCIVTIIMGFFFFYLCYFLSDDHVIPRLLALVKCEC